MGKIMHVGVPYSGSSREFISLTQAEYDVLSSSEKNNPNRMYFITDASIVTASTLNDLSDVTISNVAEGHTLGYIDGAWRNIGAFIELTYSDEFKGATITCTQGTTVITKVAPSNTNTITFGIPTTGNWEITSTVGGDAYSETVNVPELSGYTVSVTLSAIPDGSTVTPTDDIQTWLFCAGIKDKAYTTLAEVLADTDTYTTLLGDSNACNYMARSTTWASTIVADADAMRLLGMYDYACDALLGNSTWLNAIGNSTYFESVLNVCVPKMTSDTAPSGVVSASTVSESTYAAWKGFDQNTSTSWNASTATNAYLTYQFPSAVKVNRFKLIPMYSNYCRVKDYTITASNDNFTTEETLYTGLCENQNYASNPIYVNIDNDTAYSYYRINIADKYGATAYWIGVTELQFYGRHETQTDIIHSAPSDTIYYLDNGSPVTLCTTDASGVGSVDWSDLPTGDITLYSSVAKNPTDLTADYSKTIKVTKNKVEGYLMPDTALYWWGYNVSVETCNTANGWSATSGGASGSFGGTLTYNTNDVSVSVGSNQIQALGSKMSLSDVTLKGILKSTTLNSNAGLTLRKNTSKVVWDNQSALAAQNVANTAELLSANNVTGYVMASCMNSRAGNIYALWYE